MKSWILVLALVATACHTTETAKPPAEPAADATAMMEVVPLKFAAAEQIAGELRSVIEGQKSKRSLRVIADPRTNSLIFSGPRDDVIQLLELVAKLDVKQP